MTGYEFSRGDALGQHRGGDHSSSAPAHSRRRPGSPETYESETFALHALKPSARLQDSGPMRQVRN